MPPFASTPKNRLLHPPPPPPPPHIIPYLLPLLLTTTAFLLYGATVLYRASPSTGPTPLSRPIQPPDLSQCFPIFVFPSTPLLNCCMTTTTTNIPVEFIPPPPSSPFRIRRAAHLVGNDYVSKYAKAVQLMKDLPHTDPRSFSQQWRAHCAFCNGAYDQVGFANLELLIHKSWLFFPWHRLFLYFHERILAKLLGDDDSFALPFWNWDSPDGMRMPSMYVDDNTGATAPTSSLYHPNRNPSHHPPALLDLNFFDNNNRSATVEENLWIMHRQVVLNGATAELFMGSPFRAGEQPEPGPGSLESIPHNTIHVWTGDPRRINNEDMGAFYAAARDPIFHAHHANIDRLWLAWKSIGGKRKDFVNEDWLDAAFLFYDEEARLVRVKVRDCLDTDRLRYRYQETENHWLNVTWRPEMKMGRGNNIVFSTELKFPVMLKKEEVAMRVRRPRKVSGNGEDLVEVLVLEGIESDRTDLARFDVYINASPDSRRSASAGQWAGSFVSLPQVIRQANGREAMRRKTNLKLGIRDIIEEVGAAAADNVLVTLVPRKGTAMVAGFSIVFLS